MAEAERPVTSKAEEKLFCELIAAAAMGMGLRAHWCPDSRKCVGQRGFPDLVIAGPRGHIFREVKMPAGETTPDQDMWGWTLEKGSRVLVPRTWETWRPADWDSGLVGAQLVQLLAPPVLAGD